MRILQDWRKDLTGRRIWKRYYCNLWCFLTNNRWCKRPLNRDGTAAGGITAALQEQKYDDSERILDEYWATRD